MINFFSLKIDSKVMFSDTFSVNSIRSSSMKSSDEGNVRCDSRAETETWKERGRFEKCEKIRKNSSVNRRGINIDPMAIRKHRSSNKRSRCWAILGARAATYLCHLRTMHYGRNMRITQTPWIQLRIRG